MARTEVEIVHEVGLHARPAAKFVKLANSFESDISVLHGARSANGKSLVQVLTLEAGQGAVVEITAEGPDADEAVVALESLLSGSAAVEG